MFNKTTCKVKFQDHQLDDYVLENSVLKSKLQSKIDALSIMTKELDKCGMERDRYKVLVEQLKSKKLITKTTETTNMYRFTPTNTISNGDMFAKTKDHNNMLKVEVEMLRSKLEEAAGDNLVLRKQLQKSKSNKEVNDNKEMYYDPACSAVEYEHLVNELEKNKKKYQQMQLDYRATLDEKEELISDRDYYKDKVQRLNHQISYLLSNRINKQTGEGQNDSPKPIVDIDALIAENKYLHERITQLQIEKEIMKRNLSKYKTLLDNRSRNYSVQINKGFSDVMNQKQVKEFLENLKSNSKRNSAAELKSICLGLFEALNDKSTALQHQRKTNQILANRLTELEKTLEAWCNGQKCIPIFPSQMLLDEYITESSSMKSDDSKDKTQLQIPEDNNHFSDSDDEKKTNIEIEESGNSFYNKDKSTTKTILPQELEDLVREALAELKPSH